MRLIDYLDKGVQIGAAAPCLTMGGRDLSYADVQRFSFRVGRALERSGIRPGDKVAVLSSNDSFAFGCVFGISRAGAVWCPINPRNEAAENRFMLDAFDCKALIFANAYRPMVEQMRPELPKAKTYVCLDAHCDFAPALDEWLAGVDHSPLEVKPLDDIAMIAGTGGTTGRP